MPNITNRSLLFQVDLFPAYRRVTLTASDVIAAADQAAAIYPSNHATVRRLTPADAPIIPVNVTLPTRQAATHFVGFRGEEYHSAVRIYGKPDFYHRGWDTRARREIADGDLIVFAYKADPDYISPYTFDDSNEPDDPAAQERVHS